MKVITLEGERITTGYYLVPREDSLAFLVLLGEPPVNTVVPASDLIQRAALGRRKIMTDPSLAPGHVEELLGRTNGGGYLSALKKSDSAFLHHMTECQRLARRPNVTHYCLWP